MRTRAGLGRVVAAVGSAALVVGAAAAVSTTASARATAHVTRATCLARPWTSASYQATSSPSALGALVLSCLKVEFPSTYRHDEVGIVGLNAYAWFENVNEFGLTSTVQRQLAKLGMPPITLEDGPGGLITPTRPQPTQLPNELALGATFDPQVAAIYGTVLGVQAHQMGYEGVQAPDLNVVRVPAWGRAMESFGESPVLAGEMGAAEAVAIASHHVIPVLKHFGPYSQETSRKWLNQLVTERALQEVYIRPFTLALRALSPLLASGGHAVGIMCSYGNVNAMKACRSPVIANELGYVGVPALVRSDLQVEVNPSALLLNGVDLIKPMNSGELVGSLRQRAVGAALDAAVQQIFTTEFAAGLVNGTVVSAQRHALSRGNAVAGRLDSLAIEERAAVLLKDAGILPLTRGHGPIAVVGDATVPTTCHVLASSLAQALAAPASCTDTSVPLPQYPLFGHLPDGGRSSTRTARFVAPSSGPYELSVVTTGQIAVTMNGQDEVVQHGGSEFKMPRTAIVTLTRGTRYTFRVWWAGTPPTITLLAAQRAVDTALRGAARARVAVVIAYDLTREGMDRNTLELPGVQDAVIAAVARRVPTIVLLASDGAVTMPWLSHVQGLLEVWSPSGMVRTDQTLSWYVPAYVRLLDGAVDPSGRLPVTFPVSTQQSPMGVLAFWPGTYGTVDLRAAPDGGLGIGYPWFRAAGWPVLFPFGYGLSYTSFQVTGGTETIGKAGLQLTVSVRDTGGQAGTEPVEVYADWPATLGEPATQLVGFGTVSFTRAEALAGTVKHAVIPIAQDALTTYAGGRWHVARGAYCLEAATYDGDPHAWSTGQVTLAPFGPGIAGPPTVPLTAAACPG